jgi:hypothetical protein
MLKYELESKQVTGNVSNVGCKDDLLREIT